MTNNGEYRSRGALPTGGAWTRIEIPAADLGLENTEITGISIEAYDGEVWYDAFGKLPASGSFLRRGTQGTQLAELRENARLPKFTALSDEPIASKYNPVLAYFRKWFKQRRTPVSLGVTYQAITPISNAAVSLARQVVRFF